MHITFTEIELEYIDKTPFHWAIRDDCPPNIRKSLERKLALLYESR